MIGGDSQQEGLAGYRLGSAYEEIGDAETAILVRNKRGFISKIICLGVKWCNWQLSLQIANYHA